MSQVLMPKATAVWLVENTTLTFEQIAAFTGLHPLEVQAIADGEVAGGMTGFDPTTNGQLTKEEIKRAEADPTARLKLSARDVPEPVARSKGPRYTPVAKRQDRPDAIAWLLKVHPELQDSQVAKLVGSTKVPTLATKVSRSASKSCCTSAIAGCMPRAFPLRSLSGRIASLSSARSVRTV